MMQRRISEKHVKYDAGHDVLHVFFAPYSPAFDDEDYPGIIIKRASLDDRVTGLVIMDYKKRKPRELNDFLPKYDFTKLKI